jgi:hypothetical protein
MRIIALAAAAALAGGPAAALSVELIENGDFEAAGAPFESWDTVSAGDALWTPGAHAAGVTPFTSVPHPPPLAGGGAAFALFDQFLPGAAGGAVLVQGFVVPAGATALTLSFDNFINDATCVDLPPLVCGSPSGVKDDLAPGAGTLYARLDVLDPGAGLGAPDPVFSTDIVFALEPGGFPPPSEVAFANPWLFSGAIDLTGGLTPGTGYLLRLGAVNDGSVYNVGFDNVSLRAEIPDVPAPAALPLAAAALGALGLLARRRRG